MIWNLLTDNPDNGGGTGDATGSIIILVLVVVAFIGFFIWSSISNKKKQKQAQEMVDNIKLGARIKTIGGICGFLVEINKKDNTIVLETGTANNKSYIRFDRNAIYKVGDAACEKTAVKGEIIENDVAEEPKAEPKVEAKEEAKPEAKPQPAKKEKKSKKAKAEEKAEK